MNVLKLDIDKKYCPSNVTRAEDRIEKALKIILKPQTRWAVVFTESSGGNIHAKVYIACRRRLRPVEIVALQAILGSDWRREAFNFVRAINCRNTRLFQERYNILFERKVKG